jgi:hypothetical protein
MDIEFIVVRIAERLLEILTSSWFVDNIEYSLFTLAILVFMYSPNIDILKGVFTARKFNASGNFEKVPGPLALLFKKRKFCVKNRF